MDIRDEGRLMWPKMNVFTLCGIVVTTFHAIMNDEKLMEDLQSSTPSSRVGLKVMRDVLNMKTCNHFIFHNKSDVYKKCEYDRKNMHYALTAPAFNTRTNKP